MRLRSARYFIEKCVQAHDEAEKRKTLGRPSIDPRMAAKQKKKSAAAHTEAPRQEAPRIVFPAGMIGSKPVTSQICNLECYTLDHHAYHIFMHFG